MKYSHFMRIKKAFRNVTVFTVVFLKLDTNSWQTASLNGQKLNLS